MRWIRAAATIAVLLSASDALSEPPVEPEKSQGVEEILVKGRRDVLEPDVTVTPERATPVAPDTTQLMDLVPGGAVDWNGPLSGQVQYRGMSGPRMGVRIGDAVVSPGGPNWMDPPLHYAPRALLDSIDVVRGTAPVSAGAETLGGAVRARLKQARFGEDGRMRVETRLEAEGRSADRAFAGGGLLAVANDRQRLELLGSADRGRSYSTPNGKVRNTRFERYQIGSGYGFRIGEHQVGASYRFNDTEDTGNPSLPMDIRFFHTQLLSGEYLGEIGGVHLEGRVYYTDIHHRMDNFSLRQPPVLPMDFRFVEAQSRNGGWDLRAGIPLPLGTLTIGTDGLLASHDMNIRNPNMAAFLIRNFNDVKRDRYGGFAEWTAEPFSQLTFTGGVRYTRVDMDAGKVFVFAGAPAGPQVLRDRFNAASRDKSDDHVDAVGKLTWQPREDLSFEIAGGRKTRSPSYLERYSWLPIEVTGGLADFHNYVGDIGLDPEVSNEVSGGFTWKGFGFYVAPRGFYKHVHDYIQGTPATDPVVIAVSTANGDPNPLEWTNVGAELYGADADAGVDLPGPLQLDGTLSWVRGKRTDVKDNLYRIAPLRGRATLSWQADTWFAAVEGLFAAEQDKVSATNGETKTHGHAIMNLYAGWEPWPGLRLVAGIDNVTDEFYRDHLSGFNRVANSSVAIGRRIPGAGRSFYARAALTWGAALE